MDCGCAKTQRRKLGKQTAIHEQVLNTQSTDELMDLYEDWAARYDQDVNDTWGYSGPERTLFWLRHYLCLLYTSPSPRDLSTSRMPSSA